jgi:hypothetical protein
MSFFALPNLISVVVGIALFLATEFFFPVDPNNSTSYQQKHFWAIMLFVLSLILGFPTAFSYETGLNMEHSTEELETRIAVSHAYNQLRDDQTRKDFDTIFEQYEIHFARGSSVLNNWAHAALDDLCTDLTTGWITLERELVPQEIAGLYGFAKTYIVATNVGSTDFYFKNQLYINANKRAYENGRPVLRFYIFSTKRHIELTRGVSRKGAPVTIDDYANDVAVIHKSLHTVYSAVIDLDAAAAAHQIKEARDLLLMDNPVVAESNLSDSWELLGARASQDEANVNGVHNYLRTLMAIVPFKAFKMNNQEVSVHFKRFLCTLRGTNQQTRFTTSCSLTLLAVRE